VTGAGLVRVGGVGLTIDGRCLANGRRAAWALKEERNVDSLHTGTGRRAKLESAAKLVSDAIKAKRQEQEETVEKNRALIDRELKRLAKARGGQLSPEAVVEAAAAKDHPLHRFFEWRNADAAALWRLDQARRMIMSAKFVVEVIEDRARPPSVRSGSVRTWIPEGRRTRVFRERAAVLSEDDQRAAWIDERITALRAWANSVIDVKELKTVRLGVEALLDEYEG